MRVCSGAGCLRVVPDDVRFCDECKPVTAEDEAIREHKPMNADRPKYAHLYDGPRWQKLRKLVLAKHPVCTRCNERLSTLADHIVPAGVAIEEVKASKRFPLDPWAGFYLMSNLTGLCRSCHGLKTNEDKAHVGPWPSVLEAHDAAPKKKWTF